MMAMRIHIVWAIVLLVLLYATSVQGRMSLTFGVVPQQSA